MASKPRNNGRATARIDTQIAEMRAREETLEPFGGDYGAHCGLQLDKWRLIHRHLRENPFQVSMALPRAEQWSRVHRHLRATVGEPELDAWVLVQRDVAQNLADGIRDMRPRKNGPCYDVLMEWVRDRKRKALAVVQWSQGKGTPRRPSFGGGSANLNGNFHEK
ncbi:MAG: hypothetical protein H6907_17475 [Hyphomicrobiales bacterium]|nr:hypothetical protein [Hyphomicrobiales bacterium]